MFPEISHHRNFQHYFPENFLENRRVFLEFGEKAPELSGLDFLEKSKMGKFEAQKTIDVQSKLGFLKQKISLSQSEKIKTLENTSEIFQTLFEMPEGVENYGLRKETFENNKQEILAFAEKTFQPFELKQLKNFTEFSGAKLQNIALKRWLKAQIFNPENYILEEKERGKNTISEQYTEEYFSNPKNNINKKDLSELKNFDTYTSPISEKNTSISNFPENSLEKDSTRYKHAFNTLYKNMQQKGEIMRKDSLIIISDTKNNRMIVRQQGKKDWVIPSVYGLSIGSIPGSGATPTGSFKLKTRSIPGEGKPASSSPNITGAAISLYGLESSNRNSFGRGILIHGMPEVNEEDIIARANTHGCTGLTEEDAIKLAHRVQLAPSAYMQQIT